MKNDREIKKEGNNGMMDDWRNGVKEEWNDER